MKQENYFTENRDLVFHFERIAPWHELAELAEMGFSCSDGPADADEARELYREALTLAGQYAGNDIAARARAVDDAGDHRGHSKDEHRPGTRGGGAIALPEPLRRNLAGLTELDLTGVSVPRRYGGESFPFTASAMLLEILARACPSTMVHYAFYMSPARMLLRFAPEHLRRQYVPRLARGEISGAVAMTEPQAGSDVGRIATTATRDGDIWRLNGRKQFITNGCGDFTIVLARSDPGSTGLTGLSLLLADRCVDRGGRCVDNYTVERAEDKVCIAGSATCGLAFDNTGAVLLGGLGEGWKEILTFMNESRIAVGVQSLGTAQAALEEARAYTAERVQMGRPLREHPLMADMLLDMEATVAALRAVVYEATATYDRVEGRKLRMDALPEGPERDAISRRVSRDQAYLRELTPLVKYFGAEETIRVSRMALQSFGGYGVIRDYDIERIFRDSLILPIYEGTSQIQALMSVKDLLKAITQRPASLINGAISPTIARAQLSGRTGRVFAKARRDFNGTLRYLMLDLLRQRGLDLVRDMIRGTARLSENDVAYVLLSAEQLTNMLAHLHAARLLMDEARQYPERSQVAAREVNRAALVCKAGAVRVRGGDRSALDAAEAWRRERTA